MISPDIEGATFQTWQCVLEMFCQDIDINKEINQRIKILTGDLISLGFNY